MFACDGSLSARHGPSSPLLATLSRAVPQRSTVPRLSITVDYQACRESTADTAAIPRTTCKPPTVTPSLLRLAARASAGVHDRLDSDALHAAALLDVIWGDSVRSSRSQPVAYLHAAAEVAARPAAVLSDLAATHLIRAERTQNPRELPAAIDAASRALEADPAYVPALFNLALALDRQQLMSEADAAWTAYLSVDSTSQWAREARDRRTRITVLTIAKTARDTAAQDRNRTDPQAMRLKALDQTTGEWADAVLRGDTARGRRLLGSLKETAVTLERLGGDRSLTRIVQAITDAQHSRERLMQLARAHRAYADGQRHYAALEVKAAEHAFATAIDSARSSPLLAEWARAFRAGSLVYRGMLAQSESELSRAVVSIDTVQFPALAARVRWMLGTTLLRAGRRSEGAARFVEAARLFERAHEREHMGAVQYLRGEAQYYLARSDESAASLHRALGTLAPYRESSWLHNALHVTAAAAAADGFTRAALRILDEEVSLATRSSDPLDATEARLARAAMLFSRGQATAAASDRDSARLTIERLPVEIQRSFRAELGFQQLVASKTPMLGADVLDSLVSLFSDLGNSVRLLSALLARADVSLNAGQTHRAAEDVNRAANLLGAQNAQFVRDPLHRSMLDSTRSVVDRVVMQYVSADSGAAALAFLEGARAMLTPGGTPRRDVFHLPTLSANAPIVDYALIADTMLVWVINSGGTRLARSIIDHSATTQLIARTRASLELASDTAATRNALAQLYDLLVRPIDLARVSTITVVVDGEFSGVPFAALLDSVRNRFVAEDLSVRTVPGLWMLAADHSNKRPARAGNVSPREVLIVADPAFDQRRFPALPRLRGAELEAQALADAYPGATMMAGSNATRPAFEAAAARAAIVHLAGHAIVDDERPDAAIVPLAPTRDPADVGYLTTQDIRAMNFSATRLVVLSACESGGFRSQRYGGLDGLSGAFIAAGAKGVVGSLWRVDDLSTKDLMMAFHDSYRTGGDAARALQAAQLRLLRSTNVALRSPAIWGAFRYVGR